MGVNTVCGRNDQRLETSKQVNQFGLRRFKDFEVGFCSLAAGKDGAADCPDGIMNRLVNRSHTRGGWGVHQFEKLPMRTKPPAEMSQSMCYEVEHILAGCRLQDNATQDSACPLQVCLDSSVEFGNETRGIESQVCFDLVLVLLCRGHGVRAHPLNFAHDAETQIEVQFILQPAAACGSPAVLGAIEP